MKVLNYQLLHLLIQIKARTSARITRKQEQGRQPAVNPQSGQGTGLIPHAGKHFQSVGNQLITFSKSCSWFSSPKSEQTLKKKKLNIYSQRQHSSIHIPNKYAVNYF